MSIARDYALRRLDQKRLPGWQALRLPRKFAQAIDVPLDPRDLGLAEQIESGVVKNLLQLHYWTEVYSGRPLAKIHPLLQKIIAIGIYQLRFLDRIPPSAAVDEAVEQAKRFGLPHTAGFANAVLRKAAREHTTPLPDATDPRNKAMLWYSHPPELFDRLAGLLGPTQALAICVHNNMQPPTTVRLAAGKSLADIVAICPAHPHSQEAMVILNSPDKPAIARLAQAAIAQAQDPTSAQVITNARLTNEMSFLDRCCGVGTKTLQAWESLGPSAKIVAMDSSQERCDILRSTLATRRISNVQVVQAEMFPNASADLPREFERILVDVPCSNSGVLARRPEARYSQSPRALEQLRKLQKRIVTDAAKLMSPKGLLIYSTCSIWPEENQGIVESLLHASAGLSVLEQRTTLPSCTQDLRTYHDGGYFALIQRT